MRKNKTGLCTIHEYNQLKTRIFDAIDEWLNYCDADLELGISFEPTTLVVNICKKDDAQAIEWFPFETLAPHGEADADAVLNLVDKYCFVR